MSTRKPSINPCFLQDGTDGYCRQLADVSNQLHDRMDEITRAHSRTEKDIESMKVAFPAADYDGHRRYHQLLIEKLEETRKLRIAIQEKSISGLVWMGIIALGSLLWKGLLAWWATFPK